MINECAVYYVCESIMWRHVLCVIAVTVFWRLTACCETLSKTLKLGSAGYKSASDAH